MRIRVFHTMRAQHRALHEVVMAVDVLGSVLMGRLTPGMSMKMVVERPVRMLVHVAVHGLQRFLRHRLCSMTHRLYPLYSKYKNSGAPRKLVMAPIGRITGDMIMRASRSLAIMMAAPKTTDAGSKNR